jgi:hypothetical protein
MFCKTHARLGDRIRGGISSAIRRLANNQGVKAWMDRLNTALLVHNALMLSSNLIQSMGYVVDTVLDIVGIRFQDAEGEEIDTNTLVGKTVYLKWSKRTPVTPVGLAGDELRAINKHRDSDTSTELTAKIVES